MFRKTLLSVTAAAFLAMPSFAADLVDTATTAGTYSMLIQSLEKAGLVDTLRAEGPFTVFAPTDKEGFAEIEEGGEVEELWSNVPKLTAVLTYHVVPGRIMAADLAEGMKLMTLEGHELTVTLDGGPKVNGAAILTPDIEADNGVIHAIDKVLMPPQ
jgi:uncharacterized surface protein with fasciclin (FAS1) repeats